MILVTLVGWIFDYSGCGLGVLICLSVVLILWLGADVLEKIDKVMRAATEELQKK